MDWEVSKLVFLHSAAGGIDQQRHQDFPESEISKAKEKGKLQAGVLIGIEQGTKIKIWPISGRQREPKYINLQIEDLLVFTGELQHCGCGYKVENLRMQAALTVEGVKFDMDAKKYERYNPEPRFICQICGIQEYKNRKLLSKHFQRCDPNGKESEKRETHDKQPTICPYCQKRRRLDHKYKCKSNPKNQ